MAKKPYMNRKAHRKFREPSISVWETARMYVTDQASVLGKAHSDLLLGYIRARDWMRLSTAGGDIEPALQTAHTYAAFAQVRAFFKKNADFADKAICLNQAKNNFELAEQMCKRTNRKLDWYSLYPGRLPMDIHEQVIKMKRIIASTCGDVAAWRESIPTRLRITSGATSSSPRRRSVPYMKIRKTYRVTPGAAPYVDALVRLHTGASPRLVMVWHNRVTTVPKDSLTDRTIGCEPEGNLPVQLTIDSYWKENLLKVGCDLRDQTRNQRLALQGSLDDSLATIDLSMASDTVALNTVLFLFPEDWVQVLMSLRSPCYKGAFGYGTYQKFSSMGNGFTFALETILFRAAVLATGSEVCSVYGDDIICDASHYDAVIRLLRFLGFKANGKKSYRTGPFRESCGADYHSGVAVRPFFWKGTPTNRSELAHYVNGLAGIGVPDGRLWDYLRRVSSNTRLLRVPFNESSSSGVWVAPSAARERKLLRCRGGIDYFRGHVFTNSTSSRAGIQSYLYWHLRASARPASNADRTIDRVSPTLWSPRKSRMTARHVLSDVVEVSVIPLEGGRDRIKDSLHWHPPVGREPVWLNSWTEFIFA
jgi:hypothetical protein